MKIYHFECLLAVVLLVYYICILAYAGRFAAFSKPWLAGGLAAGGLGLADYFLAEKNTCWWNLLPEAVQGAAAVFVVTGLCIFGVAQYHIIKAMRQKPPEKLKYLIVLGAHVRGSIPSNALKKRLDRAEEYLRENPETMVIVSGGQGVGEDITEALAMKRYLLEKGIEGSRILEESCSVNTRENIRFSSVYIDSRTEPVGIVTNNFHIFRGISIAKKQGFTRVWGLPAESDRLLQISYLTREGLAVIKDKCLGNI